MRKITALQVFTLYSLSMYTTFTAFLINPLASNSKYSSLLASLIGPILAWILIYPALKVTKAKPDQFIIVYGHELVGKWLHIICMLMIVIVNLVLGATTLRQMSDFLLTEYLIGTPSWAVLLLFSLTVAYAVYSGISTIFRASQGIFLLSALAYLLIPIFASSEVNAAMIPAFFTHLDMKHFGDGLYLNLAMFGEIAFLFLLRPYLKTPDKSYRSLLGAVLFAVFINLTHLFLVLTSFGPEVTSNMSYPDLELIAFIQTGSFLQTGDPILIILWLTSLFVKICFTLFMSAIGLAQLVKVMDHRPFALPVTAFTTMLSIILVRTQVELNELVSGKLPGLLIVCEIVIPIIYWIGLFIRNLTHKHKEQRT
ncbi:GerAB/ArcD/ProY family transporter [Paenibacillus aceti]|uniref:Germination protein n=1 Tax=Paenibacillus aceti TaxID=1820010 RepID=A0ABQ1W497_9BACL|nr:GerAB/ArcD/ProY family transporter [Paenibacillus aceti]GGG13056.1 germination protein [Paenibacillus aceti]